MEYERWCYWQAAGPTAPLVAAAQADDVAMALSEKLHHSAQKVVEQHVVPREQKAASAREAEEKNALYGALWGQKTPLPGMRTVSTAPVPQVVLPDLGGEVVRGATLVAFLLRLKSWRGRRRRRSRGKWRRSGVESRSG